ncbi:hypothetical protein QBC38DRAFT_287409 [Podospora fimiseda]|uniref:Calpain catalytic domain-containing protein n=1 Tax=Podospora fimiseda TaxID=252190 RepID=A0AAN7GXW9_9PEZI|nr:hypothetical protein QBC38DRAFT_287409 [Podospora fimiseda]
MEAQALEHERRLEQSCGAEALKHAIAAAELYMQAAAKAKAPADRSRLSRKCAELIGLGERLKANARNAAAASRLPVPESTRILTTAEKTIILRASRLHGNIFPPWDSDPDPKSFTDLGVDGDAYIDPSEFSLSPEQEVIFDGWKRPSELVPRGDDRLEESQDPDHFMIARNEIDLAQDLATDCSVVASLCAAARHFSSTKGSLLSTLIYPFDHEALRPKVSKNGKYIFRMNFNGSWRHVVIDDRLPATTTDRTLYVVDKRNPSLLWPALIEKAYLKIRGGYDFPGSNSGTDLHVLTGWIPEQIFLQSDDIELDQTWTRIKKAYDEWHAILTLGTGNIQPEEEKALGLVREHDYAVLDLKREGESRLLLIKNPWCDSMVWTGVGSSATLKVHTVGETPDNTSNKFWMAFEDVLQHFDSLYVNWNPALFAHRQDHHFVWEVPEPIEELVFTKNPQYSILSPSGSPAWVLLNRHWQDGELDILRERKAQKDHQATTSTLAHVSKQLGFMSLSIFATSPPGTRVPLPESQRCLVQGPYVDSPNTLLRYNPTPNVPQTLVIAQGELPLPKYSFSLSFFSSEPLTISPAPPALPHTQTITGSWTRRTAGGSAVHPTYSLNPQYSLTIPRPTALSLLLSTPHRDLPVHISILFNSGNKRQISVTGRDILASSSEYQRGCTYLSLPQIDCGTYTIVLSTFEPGQLSDFSLTISSFLQSIKIEPVPSDAAGKLRTDLPLATFTGGNKKLRAPLSIARLVRLHAVARSSPSSKATLRLSLELGIGPHKSVLAVSGDGEFADASLGLRTDEIDVDPGAVSRSGGGKGLWVVLEQMGGEGGGGGGGVQVEVLSDGIISLGAWQSCDDE